MQVGELLLTCPEDATRGALATLIVQALTTVLATRPEQQALAAALLEAAPAAAAGAAAADGVPLLSASAMPAAEEGAAPPPTPPESAALPVLRLLVGLVPEAAKNWTRFGQYFGALASLARSATSPAITRLVAEPPATAQAGEEAAAATADAPPLALLQPAAALLLVDSQTGLLAQVKGGGGSGPQQRRAGHATPLFSFSPPHPQTLHLMLSEDSPLTAADVALAAAGAGRSYKGPGVAAAGGSSAASSASKKPSAAVPLSTASVRVDWSPGAELAALLLRMRDCRGFPLSTAPGAPGAGDAPAGSWPQSLYLAVPFALAGAGAAASPALPFHLAADVVPGAALLPLRRYAFSPPRLTRIEEAVAAQVRGGALDGGRGGR